MKEIKDVATLKISDGQRRTIYGMATQLGLYEKGNKDDDLHAIVYRVTGKESIGKLSEKEAGLIIGELVKLKSGSRGRADRKNARGRQKTREHRPGMITPEQEKAVWFYMYRLEEMDEEPAQMTRAERLCAVIKKYMHVDAAARDPMRFMSFKAGSTLIEVLKKMVQYEKRKAGVKSK